MSGIVSHIVEPGLLLFFWRTILILPKSQQKYQVLMISEMNTLKFKSEGRFIPAVLSRDEIQFPNAALAPDPMFLLKNPPMKLQSETSVLTEKKSDLE